MAVYKCKICGGKLNVAKGEDICTCEYCGTTQTIISKYDKKISNIIKRGNELIKNCQFDDAQKKYEEILIYIENDPEIYWNILLCKFGVFYEKDPYSGKMIPTVHRCQDYSVFLDEDYKLAIEYSNSIQKEYYLSEAKRIDNIQKKYYQIIATEKPVDIFICYKQEDDKTKQPTNDFKIAYELYNTLTNYGYNVFFSHVTLEDKIGEEYEPYIYAALKSSKVLLAVGTKSEYYNAVWVKNEWSRFMFMMNKNHQKKLIPVCSDTNVLPLEFSRLQAIEINNNIVWQQDLIRGVNKIINSIDDDVFITQELSGFREYSETFENINDNPLDNKTPVLNKKVIGFLIIMLLAAVLVFSINTLSDSLLNSNQPIDFSYLTNELNGLHVSDAEQIVSSCNIPYSINYEESLEYDKDIVFKVDVENPKDINQVFVYLTASSGKKIDYNNYYGNGNTNIIMQVSINKKGNNVKIRNTPVVKKDNSNKVGNIHTNEVYNVYEEVQNDNYTWYRIGDNKWVATDGTWMSKCPSFITNIYSSDTMRIKITKDHKGVYSSPDNNREWLKSVWLNEEYRCYNSFERDGYTWYEIGENQWLKTSGSNTDELIVISY